VSGKVELFLEHGMKHMAMTAVARLLLRQVGIQPKGREDSQIPRPPPGGRSIRYQLESKRLHSNSGRFTPTGNRPTIPLLSSP